jgi:arylsulfatase A-like enzyme
MITRRSLLGGIAGGAFARAAKSGKPNFLFILADDHAGYVLGVDGNSRALTPNLDRFAAEGTRFARNFCNSPVCTPSRQSFFTGQMPHMAGVTVLKTALAEDKPTLAKQFRGAGYQTAVFGKMHFNAPAHAGQHGFDVPMTEGEITKAWTREIKPKPLPPDTKVKPPWHPFKDPASIWLNSEKLPYARRYEDMRGTYIARQGVKFLEEHKDEQFALWVSFQEPHSPFDFPVEYSGKFDAAYFPVPRVGPEDAWQIPLIFRDLTDEQKRGIIAAYYTSVNFLDRNIGVVLDKLRELKLDQNTYVVYMADHGYSLGQHGRFEKHCCFEPALRVPLMMRFPGRIQRGGVITDFTESIDVPPTILEVMNVDRLPVMHGRSLVPYLQGKKPAVPRDHIFSEYLENEEACIRTARHKFIFCSGKRVRDDGYKTDNPTPGRYIRLYDLEKDPGEFTDIAKSEPETVNRLQGLMLERFRKTHPDAAREPKGLSVPEAIEFYLPPRDA